MDAYTDDDFTDDPENQDGRYSVCDRFLRDLDALMLDNRTRFARATLEGIYATVSRTGRVTTGQLRAVANIRREAR